MEYIEIILKKISELTKKQMALIVLVGILIWAVSFFGLNPAKKLAEMRNAQRRSDVATIINGIYQYKIDNNGNLPEAITNEPKEICREKAVSCDGLVDLSFLKIESKYMDSVPSDPKEKDQNAAGYQIWKLANGRISVSAPRAEKNATISLSK